MTRQQSNMQNGQAKHVEQMDSDTNYEKLQTQLTLKLHSKKQTMIQKYTVSSYTIQSLVKSNLFQVLLKMIIREIPLVINVM